MQVSELRFLAHDPLIMGDPARPLVSATEHILGDDVDQYMETRARNVELSRRLFAFPYITPFDEYLRCYPTWSVHRATQGDCPSSGIREKYGSQARKSRLVQLSICCRW